MSNSISSESSLPRPHFKPAPTPARSSLARLLDGMVDWSILAVPLAGPWFMGGRHPLGELVIEALAVIATIVWLASQLVDGRRLNWKHSPAEWLLSAGLLLVLVQLIPLPTAMLDLLSPHTRELLPLWRGDATTPGTLGTWSQVSLTPAWTQAGLMLLIAYGMLFLVAVQRLRKIDDVEWFLRWLAIAVTVQAVFGILQYLTSNGKFVWIYQHPFRDTYGAVMGAYINKNHFAHLMALGLGPLLWLMVSVWSQRDSRRKEQFCFTNEKASSWQPLAALFALSLVLFAGLMTLSRGGAAAMLSAALVCAGAMYHKGVLSKRLAGALGGVFVLIGMCLAVHGYSKVSDRLDDYGAGSLDALDHTGVRRAIWQADFKATHDYLLCGSGVGSHREIYPMYLNEPWEVEFTHAENGYLQVALETGLAGLTLILAGIGLSGWWCYRGLRRTENQRVYLAMAAVSGALLASVLHSLADFVWYIPSLMAVTVLLLACAFRLAEWSHPAEKEARTAAPWPAWQTGLLLAATCVAGIWMMDSRFRATMAESHWDQFLVYALQEPQDGEMPPPDSSVVDALEQVVAWTPDNAKAQVRLAGLQLAHFEQLQKQSANAMPLNQICEAALASRSQFPTRAALDQWMNRAIGEHRRLLDMALWHLRSGLSSCPLLGEGYVHLADLCFLSGQGEAERAAYLQQALQVRPFDGVVLLAAGSAAALRQDLEGMISYWRPVLHCRQQERLTMIKLLVSAPVSIDVILNCFRPDLESLRMMRDRYAKVVPPDQLQPLYQYYVGCLQAAIKAAPDGEQAVLWYEMYQAYQNLHQPDAMFECLRRGAKCEPPHFNSRFELGLKLCERQDFAGAEPWLKWCAARAPNAEHVQQALLQAVKGRADQLTNATDVSRLPKRLKR